MWFTLQSIIIIYSPLFYPCSVKLPAMTSYMYGNTFTCGLTMKAPVGFTVNLNTCISKLTKISSSSSSSSLILQAKPLVMSSSSSSSSYSDNNITHYSYYHHYTNILTVIFCKKVNLFICCHGNRSSVSSFQSARCGWCTFSD